MEVWKDIIGYEGLYQVSNWGRVKSLNYKRTGKERLLNPKPNNKGYMRVTLYKNKIRTKHFVHRLVAQTFIPNPNNYPEVNHKDENPNNNHLDNLEWCDRKYNINYGTRRKRQSEKMKGRKHNNEHKKKNGKKIINLDTREIFNSLREAGEKYNIAPQGIYRVCKGRNKRAGGYRWSYYGDNDV